MLASRRNAGVTVSCVDAATQTDHVLITAAPQSSSYNAALTEASASTQKDMSEPLSQKEKQKQDKADKKLNSLFVKPFLNSGTRQQGLLTPNSGERRNLYQIQIGSRKDLMIRLGSKIGFRRWKTWRQRNLHHVFQRELLCAYLLPKNRSNLLLHVFNT